jgi:replication factor A1
MNRNGTYTLSSGAIREIGDYEVDNKKNYNVDYYFQILSLRKKDEAPNQKPSSHIIFTCTLSDGQYKYTGFVLFADPSQENLANGDIIRAYSLSTNFIQSQKNKVYLIKKFEIIDKGVGQIGNPELLRDNNTVGSDSKERQSISTNGVQRPQVNVAGGNSHASSNSNSYNNNSLNNPSYNNQNNNTSYNQKSTSVEIGKKSYYMPLASLTTFTKDIQILVRCCRKTELKNFMGKNGQPGSLFSFNIMDSDGSEMQVTCFNKACDKFYNLIQENKVYEIIGGYVKINDKKYSSVKSEYKLILEDNTRIEEKEDDSSIKQISFNFVKIVDIGPMQKDSTIDVYGVVLEAQDKITKKTKAGKDAQIRKLTLVDDSEYKIEFTLWKNHADDDRIQQGSVLAIKNAKVGDFNGRSMSTVDDTKIIADPEFPMVQELKSFVDNYKGEWKTFTGNSGSHQANPEAAGNQAIMSIKDAIAILDSGEPDDRIPTVKVKATVCTINHSDKNFYAGCPEKNCKKKLIPDTYGFICPNCNTNRSPIYYYTLSLRIKDFSAEHWIDVFGDLGAKLFKYNCEEYKDFVLNSDTVKLKEINANLEFKTFIFTGKPKLQMYNSVAKKKINVWRIDNIDTVADARRLIKNLKSVLNIKN